MLAGASDKLSRSKQGTTSVDLDRSADHANFATRRLDYLTNVLGVPAKEAERLLFD